MLKPITSPVPQTNKQTNKTNKTNKQQSLSSEIENEYRHNYSRDFPSLELKYVLYISMLHIAN
jgi:hypothetical protein